jgi:phosphonate transport system ATP-binding protein
LASPKTRREPLALPADPSLPAAIHIEALRKSFGERRALDDVSLSVASGEMVALIGASGSGKSTMLRHVNGLAAADRGEGMIAVDGRDAQRGGRLARDIRRTRARVGFVFQQFNLVPRLDVLTNVLAGTLGRVPLWRGLLRVFTTAERAAALRALTRVGIAEQAYQRASTLSGGQQQRAAIARALVQQARIILADEPIASLDPESARRVMEILADINRADGITVVVSLHQVGFALRYCRRVVALKAGRIVYDGPTEAVTPAMLRQVYGAESDIDFGEVEATLPEPAQTPLAGALAGA